MLIKIQQLFPDFCRAELGSGIEVDVIIDGNRDDDGCLWDTQIMVLVFRNSLHERRFEAGSHWWHYINSKYCKGKLDIF